MINAGVSRTHLFIYTGECAATSKDQRQSRQFYSFPVLLDCHLKSGVQYCADTVLTIGSWGKKYPCFLPLSSFHSTNVSIKAHFKLPTGHTLMYLFSIFFSTYLFYFLFWFHFILEYN